MQGLNPAPPHVYVRIDPEGSLYIIALSVIHNIDQCVPRHIDPPIDSIDQ